MYLVLILISLVCAVPFARYNLRLCRCDTRGAIRLALFAICTGLSTWLIGGAHVASVAEGELFLAAAMRSVFAGVTLGLMYVSFEPFVRRRWPQTLVSWSRLLAGGFRDPLVGRDLLAGTTIGLALALLQGFGSLLYQIVGIPAVRVSTSAEALLGGRHLAGAFLFLIGDVLTKSLGTLFRIFLFRTLLRKQWLTAGVVVIVLAALNAINAINPFIGWPVNIAFFGLAVFVLMRLGLLALVIAYFISIFLSSFPLTYDLSAWYAGDAAFTLIAALALAVFGFRTALAGQPLFKDDLA